ncbi:sugar phosphate nucleotidyltransferase [Brooklawnia cerclae]
MLAPLRSYYAGMTGVQPTKAVVLARGLGTRMRRAGTALSAAQARIADMGLKAMMPIGQEEQAGIGGRPFVDYVISALADAGIIDVCLVIGPEHQLVRDYYTAVRPERVAIHYAEQTEPLGTGDAVRAAEAFAGDDRFVMVNSDNYYSASSLRLLAAAPGTALVGFDAATMVARSNIPAERLASFAIVDTDAHGHLVDILEKPSPDELRARGEHALVSMNCFLFSPSIFPACASIGRSPRGEYEIVDAVRALVSAGEAVSVVRADDAVLDLSGRSDVPAVMAALDGQDVRL